MCITGAFAGASLGSAAGQCSEKGINHSIDKEFQTDGGTFDDFNGGKFAAEVAFDGTMGALLGGTQAKVTNAATKRVCGEGMKKAGGGGVTRWAQKKVVKKVVAQPFKEVRKMGRKTVSECFDK